MFLNKKKEKVYVVIETEQVVKLKYQDAQC